MVRIHQGALVEPGGEPGFEPVRAGHLISATHRSRHVRTPLKPPGTAGAAPRFHTLCNQRSELAPSGWSDPAGDPGSATAAIELQLLVHLDRITEGCPALALIFGI